jgi:hypothetical protein
MKRLFDIKTTPVLLGAASLSLGLAPVALAHHSFAMFDNTKEVVLEGVIRDFQWTNPHGWIHLTVQENGQPVDYAIELSSVNSLSRHGWNHNSLKAGERVKATVHPLKTGGKGGSFMSVAKADGSVLGPTAPT